MQFVGALNHAILQIAAGGFELAPRLRQGLKLACALDGVESDEAKRDKQKCRRKTPARHAGGGFHRAPIDAKNEVPTVGGSIAVSARTRWIPSPLADGRDRALPMEPLGGKVYGLSEKLSVLAGPQKCVPIALGQSLHRAKAQLGLGGQDDYAVGVDYQRFAIEQASRQLLSMSSSVTLATTTPSTLPFSWIGAERK